MHNVYLFSDMNHGIDLSLIPEAVRPHVVWLISAHDAKERENTLLRETLRRMMAEPSPKKR